MLIALLLACAGEPEAPPAPAGPGAAPGLAEPGAPPHPGGACAGCHPEEAAAWAGSQHDRATGEASEALGRFDGAAVAAGGVVARPLRTAAGLAFQVDDGLGSRRWPVVGTVGVSPLQQYLLDDGGGRLLVAPIAWDVSGERWFDPSVEGAAGDPGDPLYWAGLAGSWNHQCAPCHTAGWVEGYDVASGSYRSHSSAPDVGCEACHGGGDEPLTPRSAEEQVATCGPCHSRRVPIAAPGAPGGALLDHYSPALLDGPTYSPDGGIRPGEEAFELGSWLQSAMHGAGVRCTDCHEAHGGAVLASGDALCTRCHVPNYATRDHHGHREGGPGSACVDCHMPAAIYMGIDARREHSMRPPSPALSAAVGAPDACTSCHRDRDAAWAQAWLDGRGGEEDAALSRFVRAVAAARAGEPAAAAGLIAAVGDGELGAFRRASALALLRRYPPAAGRWLGEALGDEDPLVRTQAAATAGAWGLSRALGPMLEDPVRAVRIEAMKASLMGGVDPVWQGALEAVIAEYEAALLAEADLPSSHSDRGLLRLARGDTEGAIAAFRAALALEPGFPPAAENLAAVLGTEAP